jgi:tRNA(His) 5'-end guanylyltransferase
MASTAEYVMTELQADIAYTQSDEITLIIIKALKKDSQGFVKDDSAKILEQTLFSSRIQKLCSISASLASIHFNKKVLELLPKEYYDRNPVFDSRVFNVPSLEEAANVVLWRELDAEKNSISAMAQSMFPHQELQNKNGAEMIQMIKAKGLADGTNRQWSSLPVHLQRGSYFQRLYVTRKFTAEELEKLPEKHNARKDPNLKYTRAEIKNVTLPRLVDEPDKCKTLFTQHYVFPRS